MNFFKKLLKILKRKFFQKYFLKFKNFEEAEIFCNLKTKNCYESNYLSSYKYEKLEQFLSNNGSLKNIPSSYMLLYSSLIFLKNNPNKIPRFIDFGGACGESIILLSSIFGKEILKSSWVIESPVQTRNSRKYDFSKNINFSSDLESVLEYGKFDIFFSSCAIHYLKEPYKPLEIVAKRKVPYICLTRNNFSSKPYYFAQVSNISANGTGEHLENLPDIELWYPAASIEELKVKNIFTSQNYSLFLQEKGTQTGVIDKQTGYSNDLFFSLN